MVTSALTCPTFDPLRTAFEGTEVPVIIFNKSHSGSRMLAELVAASGVFLGSHVNESYDSLDLLELVNALVENYYPDYGPLWNPKMPADTKLADLACRAFNSHLGGVARSASWGWKLCETVYILPVLNYCFPGARYIHLIRDGRDVAFCDHRAPDNPFWRKVYFNTHRIRTFRGRRLTPQSYRRNSAIYNALHWQNSVTLGRNFGMMLRDQYMEVRYEDLCLNFEATARRVLDFINAPRPDDALHAVQSKVYVTSVGKYQQQPERRVRDVMAILKPLLLSLGYLENDPEPPRLSLWHSRTMDNLIDRWRKRQRRN